VSKTLGNPAFRHETPPDAVCCPNGFITTSHRTFETRTFRLWNRDGKELNRLEAPSETLYLLSSASPEVFLLQHDRLRIVNLTDGQSRAEFEFEGAEQWALSPDGKSLALMRGGLVQLVLCDQGVLCWSISLPSPFTQYGLSFSANGRHLMFKGSNQKFHMLETQNGTVQLSVETRELTAWTLCPDSESVYLAEEKGEIHCYHSKTGKGLWATEPVGCPVSELIVSPCGGYLVSIHYDDTLILWNIQKRRKQANARGVSAACFDSEATLVMATSAGLLFTDLKSGKLTSPGETHQGHHGPVRAILTVEGDQFLSAGDDGRLLLWSEGQTQEGFAASGGALETIALSPNGTLVAVGSPDTEFTLWDLERQCALELETVGHNMSEWSRGQGTRTYNGWLTRSGVLGFSPDGTRLVAVVGYDTLVCWDVESGAVLHSVEAVGHFYYSEAGVFSPEGVIYNGFAYASPGQVEVWKWATPSDEPLSRFGVSGKGGLTCMEISPSKILVLGYGNGNLEAFDTNHPVPKPLARAEGRKATILSLAAGPDGHFAVGGDDGSVQLWQPSKKLLTTLPDRTNGGLWCSALAFSSDGSELIVGHGNGVITRDAWR
jgi:WD40 repeat protein